MKRRIRGQETEYGLAMQVLRQREVAGVTEEMWRPLSPDEAAQQLFRPLVTRSGTTNVFLKNGGRLYLDVGSHPEYATPECDRISDLIVAERAGDRIIDDLADRALAMLQDEGITARVQVYKNNTDSTGHSYGSHENYQVTRERTLNEWVDSLTPFLVVRQLLCGAGKWVVENGVGKLWLSQRAAHLWDPVSSTTTRARPLVNSRDEPHADPKKYRRLHVMAGDSNLSQPTVLLRYGATELMLRAIEDGHLFEEFALADPAGAIREVARHRDGRARIEQVNGRMVTPLDVLDKMHQITADYVDDQELAQAHQLWQTVLEAVADRQHARIERTIDWAIKEHMLVQYAQRHKLSNQSPQLAEIDLAYHDIHRGADARARGLFAHAEVAGHCDHLVELVEVAQAMTHPLSNTRARLRGRLIAAAKAAQRDFTVDWMTFTCRDLSDGTIVLADPLASEDPRVDRLIERMNTEPRRGGSVGFQPPVTQPPTAGTPVP
ncbi:proteasome accessory factor PafA2 family protein [Propionibacteriaceae bacterium G57]|uniref:proteasome accessory factor PafA2 family protein n=1 Tax=Aestuariimicrobium sp. G57 TaxID=3418485 RepID=UPI003DA7478A